MGALSLGPDFDGQPGLTLAVATEAVEPGYRKLVEELPAGITYFALHAPRRATSRRSRRSTRVGGPTNIPSSHPAP